MIDILKKISTWTDEHSIPIVRILFGILFAYMLFTLLRGASIPTDGGGIDTVREQLRTVGDNQQSQQQRIVEAQKVVGELEKSNSDAQISVGRIEEGEREAGELIRDCQRILREVRQRGKEETSGS